MQIRNVPNVIYVDFSGIGQLSEREQFLQLLSVELDPLDFADFIESIDDPTAYLALEDDLKSLVDRFYQLSA